MEQIRILATAKAVPPRLVKNAELADLMDTSDDWIASRTGIHQRHVSQGATTSDLATAVGQQLLKKAALPPTAIDLLVVATMSPDSYTPATAAIVQGKLGAIRAVAFDISAACSGFIYALSVVSRQLRPGQRALVIASEVLSKLVDWHDRTTAVLFGDGAGGVLVEKGGPGGILGADLATFGRDANQLSAGTTRSLTDFPGPVTDLTPFRMNGRAVYRFATHEVPSSITRALRAAGVQVDRVDRYLLHQANLRIINQVARQLGVALDHFAVNIQNYGNTAAASDAILLAEEVAAGRIKRGDYLVLAGFGGGLTVGTLVIQY